MNDIITIRNIIYFSIIMLIFYGPWQKLLISLLRQKLFEFRDYLFFLGADGELDFKSETYKRLREKINIMIRYAHKLDWLFMLLTSVNRRIFVKLAPGIKPSAIFSFEELISNVKDELTKESIYLRLRKIMIIILIVMVMRSLFLSVLSIVLLPFIILDVYLFNNELGIKKNKTKAKRKFNHIQDVLEEEDEYERYAAA